MPKIQRERAHPLEKANTSPEKVIANENEMSPAHSPKAREIANVSILIL